MFDKLEQLAKDNKKISDFHLRAGAPMAYRQTGEIVKVADTPVTAQDLKDLIAMNCNEKEVLKFVSLEQISKTIYNMKLFNLIIMKSKMEKNISKQ